jgi:hypothetical protein
MGRIIRDKDFLELPWEQVRDSVKVKLLEQEGELYSLAKSAGRGDKERSMRQMRSPPCKLSTAGPTSSASGSKTSRS